MVVERRELRSYLGAYVSWRVVRAFEVEARRRGKKRSWLIARVLAVVANDGLFEAVIDSGSHGSHTQDKSNG